MRIPIEGATVRLRTLLLAAVLAAVGVIALTAATRQGSVGAHLSLSWWALAPAFAATDAFIFHIEIRQEAHSFSLSELPLVVGFFFASPVSLIVGRLLGHLLYRAIVQRQSLLKQVFNLASFTAETGVGLWVFRSLAVAGAPDHPRGWLAVWAAVAVADGLSLCSVTSVIYWHGGRPRLATVGVAAGATYLMNTALAVLAVTVLWHSPWEVAFLLVLSTGAALVYRGHASLRQRYASLQLLYDFTQMVGASVRAEAVMEKVLAEARTLLRADKAEIVLLDEDAGLGSARIVNCEGPVAERPGGSGPVDLSEDVLFLEVISSRRATVIPQGSRNASHRRYLEKIGARDCIVAPLSAEGRVLGTIMVADRLSEVSTFDDSDLQLFATLANHASVAFENGRLVQQLRNEASERHYEALHDSLTGLGNRVLFQQRLTDEARRVNADAGAVAAVMLMDLDRFKEVNDTLGHHSGDMLLSEVAERLVGLLRRQDTVARLGGDEFAILLPGVAEVREALDTAERVVEALQSPFKLEEMSVDVGASIGIALMPEHGRDAALLLQRADVAMYQAKGSGKSVAVYRPEDDSYSPQRLALAAELRQAIMDGDMVVHYQPKARLADREVVSLEALARWRHNERGMLQPDEFIPTAEQTGLVSPLTLWILRSSLMQLRDWDRQGHRLRVSVNLAMRSLVDATLPDRVRELLEEARIEPGRLTLEITESGVMADPPRAMAVLDRLAGLGVELSVDDFGTGYSSLSYLRRLPVVEVKVDRSFVLRMASDSGDSAIVGSIVELGRQLGLRTVAEGVEDRRTWDMLRAMGCDEAQGYYLSPPRPAEDIVGWLLAGPGDEACILLPEVPPVPC